MRERERKTDREKEDCGSSGDEGSSDIATEEEWGKENAERSHRHKDRDEDIWRHRKIEIGIRCAEWPYKEYVLIPTYLPTYLLAIIKIHTSTKSFAKGFL